MANNSSNLMKPHFFQPLKPGFQSNFSIPKAFQRHLRGDEKYLMLRDKRHGVWYVKVSHEKGKMHMKDGWKKFCEEHDLQVGDFLVFKYNGNLIFDVLIFDPNASERTIPRIPTVSRAAGAKIEGISDGGSVAKVVFKPRGFPYCHTSVKPYWRKVGGMPIPVKFGRENDLSNKWCEMILIDQKEKSWPVTLKQSYGNHPYIGGWGAFEQSNGLKAGDSIVFELINSGKIPIMKVYW
ncbi:B3 domain-containing protein REM5-like [Silene latifolia]|uniref:B3 domain-containing protein REM5-like n=1 Tax=Silene latifolia TaxID=37657 RepID=UPI003D7788E8